MSHVKTISEWMAERGLSQSDLVERSKLDSKVVEAIVVGRYTTSPAQRQRMAAALGVSPEDIRWGQPVPVDHMYGHGPQFGRSP